jgi:hypothetical protein
MTSTPILYAAGLSIFGRGARARFSAYLEMVRIAGGSRRAFPLRGAEFWMWSTSPAEKTRSGGEWNSERAGLTPASHSPITASISTVPMEQRVVLKPTADCPEVRVGLFGIPAKAEHSHSRSMRNLCPTILANSSTLSFIGEPNFMRSANVPFVMLVCLARPYTSEVNTLSPTPICAAFFRRIFVFPADFTPVIRLALVTLFTGFFADFLTDFFFAIDVLSLERG